MVVGRGIHRHGNRDAMRGEIAGCRQITRLEARAVAFHARDSRETPGAKRVVPGSEPRDLEQEEAEGASRRALGGNGIDVPVVTELERYAGATREHLAEIADHTAADAHRMSIDGAVAALTG